MTKTVLLVEDDRILSGMYQKLLSNNGYVVNIATDGKDGLNLALRDHPDLILLDIRMPKMDGMTLLKNLRADEWGKAAKVIILTNLTADEQILKGVVDDHPTYYLVKSDTKPEEVLEHVKEVV